ncbi:MAG: alpha/beta hydrolase [Chloroflexi bacterium]|nr:alpha/beta hydrolase [Chloroflexota bacterium]
MVETPRRGFVHSPHGDIEYRELGSGPALLLLHALPASSRQFAQQMWRVAEGRRVIAMTMMGCGASDRPLQPYTELPEFARTVAWLLDGLDIAQADLLGTHTGAGLAVAVAAEHPERVRRLILQEAYDYTASKTGEERLRTVHHYFPLAEDGSHLLELWRRHGGDRPDADRNRVMELVAEHIALNSDEGVAGLYGDFGWEGAAPYCILRYDYAGALRRIAAPTLVIHGSASAFGDQHERFLELLPDASGARPPTEVGAATSARPTPGLFNVNNDPVRWAAMVNGFLDGERPGVVEGGIGA